MKVIRIIALALSVAVIVLTPVLVIPALKKAYSIDIVEESKYKGVLMLWHIETFEGGSTSRAAYLEKCAKELEKTERNLFVLVRTMDIETLNNLLSEGARPDIISFGSGLGNSLKDFLNDIDDDYGVKNNYLSSGMSGGRSLAIPYMTGGYVLIGDEELLKRAGVANETALSDSLGIQIKDKNSVIPSLVVGKTPYINPNTAVNYSTNNILSQYAAYENFINKKSIMLLGSQRDVNRLIHREELGRGRAVRYEFIDGYTDLVQYIGITSRDIYKQEGANMFLKKIFSNYGQNALSDTGMFPVTDKKIYSGGNLSDMEDTVNSTGIIVKNLFN